MTQEKFNILYIRVSSEKQAEFGFSTENQLEQGNKWFDYKNLQNRLVIQDDGISGTTFERRPGIMEIQRLVSEGLVNSVATYSISRIGRDALDTLLFFRLLDRNDVIMHSITESADGSTPYGRHNLRGIASQAQLEVELLGNRVSSVLQYKKSKKQTYCKHLTGFDNQDGLLVPNEHIKTVELILKLKQQGKTDYSIAKQLNEQGLKTIHNSPFKPISITRIANNPVYSAT